MTDSDDSPGFDTAREEKRATRPDEGFALVEIDMLKPPGEALTKLHETLLLWDLSLPPESELTDYVIYDADGHDYGQGSLDEVEDRVVAGEIDTLSKDLDTDDRRTRRLALYGLHQAAEDRPEDCLDAVPALAGALDADPLDVQAAALDILARLAESHPEQVTPVVTEVIPLLDTTLDARLNARAARLIAAVADHDSGAVFDATPRLAAMLAETDVAEEPALVALTRIAASHPGSVVPVASQLVEYLDDDTRDHRVAAIATLGQVAKAYPNVAEETIPAAIDLLDVDGDQLRANAAGLLVDLADEYPSQLRDTVPRAVELLADSDEKARHNATSILARVAQEHPGDVERAIDPLVDRLDDDLSSTRANACWALGYVETERALEALQARQRHDPDEEVRHAAEVAIENIPSGA